MTTSQIIKSKIEEISTKIQDAQVFNQLYDWNVKNVSDYDWKYELTYKGRFLDLATLNNLSEIIKISSIESYNNKFIIHFNWGLD